MQTSILYYYIVYDFTHPIESLDWWQQQQCRLVWFRINLRSAALVPVLAQNGFDFHHARDGFCMMVRWIYTAETPNIPPYAHHMVGVGGLVINARDQILAVSEQQAIVPGAWKLPGGYVELAENLVEAGQREVLEETGIRTRFESLVSIRHAHGANFACSDLYVVLALRTIDDEEDKSAETTTIQRCQREIADARWMEFDEYLNHPKVHDLNRDLLRQYLQNREHGVRIGRKEGEHPLLRRKYNVYAVDWTNNAKL